jgi:hypothetical protein
MENRIEINGVWYVREGAMPPQGIILSSKDVTHYNGVVYETDTLCLEASRIYMDYEMGSIHTDVVIEVTFKTPGTPMKDWKKEYWDSMAFFLGVLDGDVDSLASLDKDLTPEQVSVFRAFISYLHEIFWI